MTRFCFDLLFDCSTAGLRFYLQSERRLARRNRSSRRCYKEEVPALSEQQPEQFTWVSSTHSTRTVAYVVAYRGKLGRQKFRRSGELNAAQARIFESFTIAAE